MPSLVTEAEVGIQGYLTTTPGVGGRIKASPEDFVVEERSLPPRRAAEGPYTVAVVRVRNWETNRLVREMARRLRISRKRIAFAGTKDKRAVTTQLIQFEVPPEAVATLRLRDVEILDAYPTDRRLEIGDLLGNAFVVRLRDLALEAEAALRVAKATRDELLAVGGFPNFFGIQRFGSVRPITHVVGRCILRGAFREAVETYVARPLATEDAAVREARTLAEAGDYGGALKAFPDRFGVEKALLNHLVKEPDDYVGALERLPFNLRLLFVHGYQAYLFNRMVSARMEAGLPLHEPVLGDLVLPVTKHGLPDHDRWIPATADNLEKLGRQCRAGKAFVSGLIFGSEPAFAEGPMGDIERAVVASEGVRPEDFVVPRMPRLSSRGQRREVLAPLSSLHLAAEADALLLRFDLTKGCYATSLLREFTKNVEA
jgi:tRNA pseudouridine13 synthase